ncbi:MAG TPA: hypothetical protein VHM25_22170, partial [Polyangiaceae bacterium]|nr:hypothetical protein [Polyangiaceae bacterium]
QAMVAAASAAAASAANSASAPARPHPLTRVVTKPASSQVSSGLLEPTDPVNAAKTSVAPSAKPSASPIRRPKAIYGSNDGAE